MNPMEVVKIRLQAQQHSLADPNEKPRYRNAAHALYTIIREEGFSTLYRGVALTAARQATNQAANFTAYQEIKALALRLQKVDELPSYETATIGLISGALGPFSNAPIDTIKTRIQKAAKVPGETALGRVLKGMYTLFAYRSRSRHVCAGGCQCLLEGHYAACCACCARPGRRVHDLREGQEPDRQDGQPGFEAYGHGQEVSPFEAVVYMLLSRSSPSSAKWRVLCTLSRAKEHAGLAAPSPLPKGTSSATLASRSPEECRPWTERNHRKTAPSAYVQLLLHVGGPKCDACAPRAELAERRTRAPKPRRYPTAASAARRRGGALRVAPYPSPPP